MTKPHSGPITAAAFAFRYYCLHVEAGVTLQDLLKPEMWSRNTDGQLRPRDKLRVIAKDGSFDCDLIVTAIMPGAGVIMQIDASGVPGSPTRKRLEAIEAEVRAETEITHQAKLNAALQGGQP